MTTMSERMNVMAKKYWTSEEIDKTEAQYRILVSERSTGKSYDVKKKRLINAYNNGNRFWYLRCTPGEINATGTMEYFNDAPISEITNGEFSTVFAYGGQLFFANLDKKGKYLKGPLIGWYGNLYAYESYKSHAYTDCTDIIYEEFINNKPHSDQEPYWLQQFVSTVFRDKSGIVWMIGNTVNKINVYSQEWQLENFCNMKEGQIDVYTKHSKGEDGEDVETKIAVEFCTSLGSSSKMFFGNAAKSIKGGEWDVYEQNKITHKELEDFTMAYELLLEGYGFGYIMQLYVKDDGDCILYVYPRGNHNRRFTRIISEKFSTNPLITPTFKTDIRPEQIMKELFYNNKICFPTDRIGTDFNNLVQQKKFKL